MTTETRLNGDTLTVTRHYNAGQAEVFEAWMDASKTMHWWGCANTTKVASKIEPQAGGTYQHLMSIDGVGEHLIDGTLTAFDPPKHLAYRMGGSPDGRDMAVRVDFEPVGDGTLVTLTQTPLPAEWQDVVAAGWTASFERLDRFFGGERRAA